MTVSILIVNWNSRHYVRQCLESIRSTCAAIAPQIIVVDAGSHDGCGAMLASDFPDAVFVQSDVNIGFGRANNLGFARARGEALLLLNPDTELRPGALDGLLDGLRGLPQAGILGPRILNSDGSLQTSCVRAFPTPLNQAMDSEWLRRRFPGWALWGTGRALRSSQPVEVDALSGACMLLPSETFRRMGGFSPEFFMYGEDLDLCFNVRQLGLKRYYVPAAAVVHHGGKSSGQQFKKFPVVLMRAADHRLIAKWRGRGAARRYRAFMAFSALLRLLLLTPAAALARGDTRRRRLDSLRKWWANLRWTLGREQWADRCGLESVAALGVRMPGLVSPAAPRPQAVASH